MVEVHYEKVFFTGRVQGVGFRFAATQVAREYDVAGEVANLTDGRVQLEVEGDKEEITQYIQSIEERMHGHIKKIERIASRRPAQFRGFAIR